ncbi:putative DNA metabolism protein [Arcticibacter pallidicorallinus]|uniref:Putative DNA metabolism protein n=1 Tax=Arcticibacter pallidicorallinus TaxID=1259464 RepID=A0A2T0U553_9SPHI|nr:TIGR03915 family putative DNA repair protein [Arcticibacter pallidicorallinus]PRY53022.1 putative DNA metabolism protein [Arcticibacter pallidicorallinus]
MTLLTFDGSWYGLLCCIFDVYDYKLGAVYVSADTHNQTDAFGSERIVYTDPEHAARVSKGLAGKLSAKAMGDLYACFLSELPEAPSLIVRYARAVFSNGLTENAFGNADLLKVTQIAKMVSRERHRMKAFIRFQLTSDNIFFAEIEPDFNVIPLIAGHFKGRYADQEWIIYDKRRKYGIYYDLQKVEEVQFTFSEGKINSNVFAESEALYQNMWKDYFKHVSIDSRKNTALHLRHVPKRYWKHLIEKQVY